MNGMKGVPPTMNGKPKFNMNTAKRLTGYIFKEHKFMFLIVLICILLSTLCSVAGSLFIQTLIDDYITPLLLEDNPVLSGLLRAVCTMAGIYLIGVLCTLAYSQIMVTIAQKVLKDIRDEMFQKMQRLPIKYFDTHTHGDLMSCYTNDTDTLRQMITQSIVQVFSSMITIVTVFVAMVTTSWVLTLVVLISLVVMLTVSKKIAGKSGTFFIKQQQSLGTTNGYIEEMINGQKVIKVFCHEEETIKKFNELNDELCYASTQANRFANILMPIMNNLGNLQYVLLAFVGGALAINGVTGITLGAIVSFLQLSTYKSGIATVELHSYGFGWC